MSTTHHSNQRQIQIQVHSSRPVRCFRHHVSMASCADCARVRTAELARSRAAAQEPATTRGTMSA